MVSVVTSLLVLFASRAVAPPPLDLSSCKLSHSGVDYRGNIATSFSGPRCRFWDSRKARNEKITDADFPDGSRKAAANRCRNPTGQRLGPWCYTKDPSVTRDICDIPLCASKGCRVSGTGMEYAGDLGQSSSGEQCLDWAGISKYRKDNPGVVARLTGRSFPDGAVKWAGRRCRNPDAWPGGPWCYVKDGVKGRRVQRAHCDVPFCEPRNCTLFTTYEESQHSDFTALVGSTVTFRFSVRLWNPGDWKVATARLVLSLITTPGSGQDQLVRKTGFELVLSNGRAYFTGFEGDGERVPGLLTASSWTDLSVTWGDEYLSLMREGQRKPVLVQDFPTRGRAVAMRAYGLSGRHVLWSVPACGDECPTHVASRETFSRLWEVRKSPTGHEVQVFVRSRDAVCVHLRGAPTSSVPDLRVCVDDRNSSHISYRRGDNATSLQLKQVSSGQLLSWWSWRELSIALSGNVLSLWARTPAGPGLAILETEVPDDVRGARWFGVSPLRGVALFTLFCVPKELDPPIPPECHRKASSTPYVGGEWTTASGLPCLPWSAPDLTLPVELQGNSAVFPDGSREAALNRCRNPSTAGSSPSRTQPFCFALRPDGRVVREDCDVRECRAAHCRLAGTANDYMGSRNVSRSGLPCRPWAEAAPASLSNSSLYPEQDVQEASNYCRNPSRSVAGTWCFTARDNVDADLCEVRDCAADDDCTVVYRGGATGAIGATGGGLYILPAWRMAGFAFSLKEWNPEMEDGIVFDLRPSDGGDFHRLAIGAAKNEKITFSVVRQGREELLNSKTVPHMVSAGQWAPLWLRFPPGRLLLGQQGVQTPIFDWPYKQGEEFTPSLLQYHSVQGHAIGLHFDCSADCQIELVDSANFTKLFPLAIWRPRSAAGGALRLVVQGTGVALLALFKLPEEPPYVLRLGAGPDGKAVSLHRGVYGDALQHANLATRVLRNESWTKFDVTLTGKRVSVRRDDVEVLSWTGILLAYMFSVGTERGAVSWAANCQPVDLAGEAVHGGWSPWGPWTCSVACGGGHGERTRTCSEPAPNILGRPCQGAARQQGPCNEWPCGQLSPATLRRLRATLQSVRQVRVDPASTPASRANRANRAVQMQCGDRALAALREEVPAAQATQVVWLANGERALSDDDREVSPRLVRLGRPRGSDSGVWSCLALGAVTGAARIPLSLWAVAVRRPLAARRTLPRTIRCNALQLALLYDHLRVSWTLDGRPYEHTASKVFRAGEKRNYNADSGKCSTNS